MTTKKTTAVERKTEALRAAAMRALPRRAKCPRCGKTKGREAFGLRVMARDEREVPTVIRRQSHCSACRGR